MKLRVLIPLVLQLAACGGMGPAPASGDGAPAKLSAAYSNVGADHMPGWIAKDAGIFLKNGLDVNLQLGGGGTKTAAALLAGDFQLVEMGGSETAAAAAGGADVLIVAAPSQVYIYKIIARRELSSLADLKGKKVAISSTGGSSDIAARVVLRRAGLEPNKDVTLMAIGDATTRQAAMLNGAVDAEVEGPPGSNKVESDPKFRVLVDLTAEGLPAANAVVAGQRSWINANRPLVQRYVDSIMQGAARAKRDRDFTIAVIKKYNGIDDEQGLQIAYDFFKNAVTERPLPKLEQFKDGLDVLSEINPRLKGFDVSRIIDDSSVKDALERGVDTG